MATAFQIKKIHILKSKLNISDSDYREILFSYNVKSSKDLDYKNAVTLINTLVQDATAQNLWVEPPKKYSKLERVNKMATPPQLRMIEGLWWELSYQRTDEFARKSLRRTLRMKLKIDDIMFLTKKDANKAINIIKAIKRDREARGRTLVSSNK